MIEEEQIKKMAELKTYIENRIKELEMDLTNSRRILEIIDEELAEKSFKRLEMPKTVPAIKAKEPKTTITLKASSGAPLANIAIDTSTMSITPAEGIVLNINTPPFQAFLMKKILEPMQSLDREAVSSGEIEPEEAFSYNLVLRDSDLKELVIRNYGDEKRLKELQTSIRWTFEKMYEKLGRSEFIK
jgi:hypothetical protein